MKEKRRTKRVRTKPGVSRRKFVQTGALVGITAGALRGEESASETNFYRRAKRLKNSRSQTGTSCLKSRIGAVDFVFRSPKCQ